MFKWESVKERHENFTKNSNNVLWTRFSQAKIEGHTQRSPRKKYDDEVHNRLHVAMPVDTFGTSVQVGWIVGEDNS